MNIHANGVLVLPAPARPSRLRAWLFLVQLSFRRQAQLRQLVWMSLGLLAIAVTVIALVTAAGRWGSDPARAFKKFSEAVVFDVVLGFLLPIWSLTFATQAVGGEREGRNLVWVLTRPLSRPAIYFAKFAALLPWSLGFNLGSFGLLCLAARPAAQDAFRLYWPAVFWGTMVYCALFCLIGAVVRRPAVVALVYSFFLEVFLGDMPGHMKRLSVSFYTRCLMFDVGRLPPRKPEVFLPVDGATALAALIAAALVLLLAGAALFSRTEYRDLT